jgi:iodotyrosine deiodinase
MTDSKKKEYPFVKHYPLRFEEKEMIDRSQEFYEFMDKRRSIREFSDKEIPIEIIENIIKTASTAPSGAHKQPWTFCLISNAKLKSEIRKLAEEEEEKSYSGRMSEEWIRDLTPLGTDAIKEFIDIAPWVIIVMKRVYENGPDGSKQNNYYVNESVGIAAGFLITAIHNAGLCTLTHTPSPMNFLIKALGRPANERPFLLLPVGYPADEVTVPDLGRKPLADVTVYYE